jgi:uncharacterized protein YbjT (DUF2867 family)
VVDRDRLPSLSDRFWEPGSPYLLQFAGTATAQRRKASRSLGALRHPGMTKHKIAVAGATGRAGRHVVEALEASGHEAVRISRADGVDIITGEGLAEALQGVEIIVDVATGPSPEQRAATDFFTTAAANLQREGASAGVNRIVVASIVGVDRFTSGYGAAKLAHEQATLAGPVAATVVRITQFHELVEQMMEWGRRNGDVIEIPRMRTQPVAARTVGEVLASVATGEQEVFELAGPREEKMVALAERLAPDGIRVQAVSDPVDGANYESGGMLPGPGALLAGPTFEEWLTSR